MKFEIDSVQACNNAWKVEDRFDETIKLYPYLKDKVTKFTDINNTTRLAIEIDSLKELTDLVEGCKCHVVYDATNEVDDDGVNGIIIIYDDYME